ncbi:MAG: cob(I)alamin adenosyltransferase, cob(I)alamin adenosyltransferase [Candidatus Peregrinibacteria bacterium GW2011_GWE2_39_6]|nr:MAG: cob(I)alamin adenosyltransferase, cob(I)alamin adenosyltransferase [Candidatus Peregrinibacteria bacterium GW2011_GWF2_39_17]KKR25793.1 MAG: cob(I)alamin adenosyltransferase, cob(I)alamin adenosyltransferase [Candidatus Peregrinibacteria bacterium GW2011_GWE2_39_6]HCW32753.1 cob(I)yrinic acid a,c-diamide adenosyltransferase [Candidatus Peregrinibacteria bacterium]
MIICYTGNGKGKTTAALGLALRASGHNLKICLIQFIKGTWETGEIKTIKKIPKIEIIQAGRGFYKIKNDQTPTAEHKKAAKEGFKKALQKVDQKTCDILILDEINVALDLKLLPLTDILNLIKKTPSSMHLVLTGRNASPKIITLADLVTEMVEIKHPFQKGISAQKGLDF